MEYYKKINNVVKISNYGEGKTQSQNTMCIDINNKLTLYFSYATIIAFSGSEEGLVVRKNEWGRTTGKHLNWISSSKETRLDGEAFEEKLKQAFFRSGVLDAKEAIASNF